MTQRALTALRIGNFKAFADTQRIPLKPITLIFGPNSAGKSSVIHSLAFAHEAQFGRPKRERSRLDVYKTEIGGAAIDLGGFSQFVYGHNIEQLVEWGADLEVPSCIDLKSDSGKQCHVSISVLVGTTTGNPTGNAQYASLGVRRIAIVADGEELLKASYRRMHSPGETRLRVDQLNLHHAQMQHVLHEATTGSNNDSKQCSAKDLEGDVSGEISNGDMDVLVDGLVVYRLIARGVSDQNGNSTIAPGYANSDPRTYFWWLLARFLDNVSQILDREYGAMEYLGPIRALPPRHFTPSDFDESAWNAGGGQAWDRVSRDEIVRDAVNKWLAKPELKTPYRLKVRKLVDPDDVESELMSELIREHTSREPMTALERRELLTKELAAAYAELNERYEYDQLLLEEASKLVEAWVKRLERARSPAEREDILQEADAALNRWEQDVRDRTPVPSDQEIADDVLNDDAPVDAAHVRAASFVQRLKNAKSIRKTPQLVLRDLGKKVDVSHRDVGTGISQVLPVLVAAYGSKDQIIAIEQPEIHLHPALQAELGDVFVESALGERRNMFILETHSEHLILRLLRRVREKKITPADMCVLYVEPTDHGSLVRELEYNDSGDFIDEWPGGFFEEAFREKFAGR